MGQGSKIGWTHHTFNPVRGCTKVSPGCANCYAATMSRRNPDVLGEWGPQGTRRVAAEASWRLLAKWNDAAERGLCHHCGGNGGKRISLLPCDYCHGSGDEDMDNRGKPYRARVFTASLGDIFEEKDTMPGEFWEGYEAARLRLFRAVYDLRHLDFLLLTKRPQAVRRTVERMAARCKKASPFNDWLNMWLRGMAPANVWLGTSVENQACGDLRIPFILSMPAAVHFLSMEPLLEAVDITRYLKLLRWVIVGGESGSREKARPCDVAWVRSIKKQCQAAGVPVFVKQLGTTVHATEAIDPLDQFPDGTKFGQGPGDHTARINLRHKKGENPAEWPEDLRVQEFPAVLA